MGLEVKEPTQKYIDDAVAAMRIYVDGAIATRVPTGVMLIWNTDTAPGGWLLCYGQAVSRATYSDLFAVIGTTFGVGDGSTTFNLPDIRGRFPLGQDDMGGVSADRVIDAEADFIGGALLEAGDMIENDPTVPYLTVNYIIKD